MTKGGPKQGNEINFSSRCRPIDTQNRNITGGKIGQKETTHKKIKEKSRRLI